MTSRTRLLLAAAAVGLLHAAVSAYWAVGGTWLVDTVGQWAADWASEEPGTAFVVLMTVAVLKAAAAVGPLLLDPGRRTVRWGLGAGGAVLALYGAANTAGAWLVLTGVVVPGGEPDRPALLGHALLWDPLFALWGCLVLAGLLAGRDAVGRQVPRWVSTR
jgi:hypothetical protein